MPLDKVGAGNDGQDSEAFLKGIAQFARGFLKWVMEEEGEAEHADDESEAAKAAARGKLTEQERAEADKNHGQREEMPAEAFLEPASRKYPVKEQRDGEWKYDRRLLLAAAREARMHGHDDLAKRADEIRAREFGQASDMAMDWSGSDWTGSVRLRMHNRTDIAFDRASAREYDADGRLRLAKSNISKANICEYLGSEIPDFEALGLDPAKRYKLLRHPDELKKAAPTFNNLPILSRHIPVSADNHQPDLVIGSTGTDAEFEDPYLSNSLIFWARDAIDDIESEVKKELSSAYRYRADMTPGTHKGEAYDGVMRDLVGNHVALVREGRAGPDVVVGDSSIHDERTEDMTIKALSRKATVAKGALFAYLLPRLAQDAKIDIAPLLQGVTQANFKEKKASIVAGLREQTKGKLAKDASIDDVAKLLDALEGNEEQGIDEEDPLKAIKAGTGQPDDDKTMDAEPKGKGAILDYFKDKLPPEHHAKLAEMLPDDAAAEDEEDDEKEIEAEAKKLDNQTDKAREGNKPDFVSKKAMDAAITTAVQTAVKTQQGVRDAERAVRPWVGDLAIAFDSADAVYGAALKMLGVKTEGVHPSAFRTILELQPKPGSKVQSTTSVAMDAAGAKGFFERFPDAAKIDIL